MADKALSSDVRIVHFYLNLEIYIDPTTAATPARSAWQLFFGRHKFSNESFSKGLHCLMNICRVIEESLM
jgi:hypothetical protein